MLMIVTPGLELRALEGALVDGLGVLRKIRGDCPVFRRH
jgi:hypothetical protein